MKESKGEGKRNEDFLYFLILFVNCTDHKDIELGLYN